MNESQNNQNPLLIPIAIIIAGALIGASLYFSAGVKKSAENPPDASVRATQQPTTDDLLKNAFTIGDPHAPVVMVEYADFQCPFCGQFFQEAYPKIIDNYVKTGRVLFAHQNFAFLGQESQDAAEAVECANDQRKFMEYHDYLYNYIWNNYYAKGASGENVGAFSRDNLKKFAAGLKLDTAVFNQCLDSGKYTQMVRDTTTAGRTYGISGTPAFFINGQPATGALPFVEFQRIIEEALKKSK